MFAYVLHYFLYFFFSSIRRHTRLTCDWSSDVCSSDLFEAEHLVHSHLQGLGALAVKEHDVLQRPHAAAVDAADADFADIAGVIERADLQLQRTVGVLIAHRYIFENRLEEGGHILPNLLCIPGCPALQRRG